MHALTPCPHVPCPTLQARKTKWGFKHADRVGAKYVVLVGGSEAAEGKVTVKEMGTGHQEAVATEALAAWVGGREGVETTTAVPKAG